MSRWADRLQRLWYEIFSLDSRSLALARILCGLLLLVDLGTRAASLRTFYTAEGLMPRSLLMALQPTLPFPSLHVANDTFGYQAALFFLNVAIAVALVAGYRSRATTVLAWIFLASLHARNSYVLNTGDSILLSFLFWGMFLPWGSSWSYDARTSANASPPPKLCISAATVGWTLQISTMYLFAALHKSEAAWWSEGSAVYYALRNDNFARGAAHLLLDHPACLKPLTWLVLSFEYLSMPLLLFPPTRLFGVVACALMHVGFAPFLFLGIFHLTPLIGLVAMLPSRIYRSERHPALQDDILVDPRTVGLLLTSALLLTCSLEDLGRRKLRFVPLPLRTVARILQGPHNWGVFTGPALRESCWLAVEIRARSGLDYDMLRQGPFTMEKPESALAMYPDQRWQNFLLTVPNWLPQISGKNDWARWWIARWNAAHPDDPATNVKIWYYRIPSLPDFQESAPLPYVLAEAHA